MSEPAVTDDKTITTTTLVPSSLSPSLNIDELSIDENKKPPKLLDDPEDSNIQAVTSGDTPYTSAARFEDLNLSEELLKGLYVEMKFQKPSKIQAISLPMILNPPHRDLIAQAHNGSGKTTRKCGPNHHIRAHETECKNAAQVTCRYGLRGYFDTRCP
ncbi:hypothetical protein AHAS_Ahas06G0238000 [Arachis hypogaea]